MIVLSKEEFEINREEYVALIKKGAIFIYPTDTIYGIGCLATDTKAVKKIRTIKKRPKAPFSVIVPSKEWIYKNCLVNEKAEEWIKKLPGPYTLILKLKNKKAVSEEVNKNIGTIGVRIPKHWFTKYVEEAGLVLITTSVNVSGEDYMTSLEDLDDRIRTKTDFLIYDGEISGRPSTIVDLTGKEPRVINR